MSSVTKMGRRGSLRAGLAVFVLIVVVAVIGYSVYMSRARWVEAGHVGVIYAANGGLQKEVITPKRVFVPWLSTLYTYPTLRVSAVYTNDPDKASTRSSDAIQITTSDNANTPFDIVVWYHVRPEDVHTVFNNFKAVTIEQIQSTFVRRAVKDAAQRISTQYDAFQLMGPKRHDASVKLTELLKKELAVKGLTVDAAEFCGAYPNEQIMTRITSQVNANTELTISQFRNDIAKVTRDTAIVRATATSKAQRLAAAQTSTKSLELLSLESEIASLKRWNGRMPMFQLKAGQTLIMSPEAAAQLATRPTAAVLQQQQEEAKAAAEAAAVKNNEEQGQ